MAAFTTTNSCEDGMDSIRLRTQPSPLHLSHTLPESFIPQLEEDGKPKNSTPTSAQEEGRSRSSNHWLLGDSSSSDSVILGAEFVKPVTGLKKVQTQFVSWLDIYFKSLFHDGFYLPSINKEEGKYISMITNAMDVDVRHPLPDLVIHQILKLLPTKAAVRMSFLSKQWEYVWTSATVLDFDEGDDPGKYDNDHIDLNKILEHRKFVNIVEKWMVQESQDHQPKQVRLLDKFRLHMMRYVPGDYDMIDKCLSFVFERSVKELDISLRISPLFWEFSSEIRLGFEYCISRTTLANAKTLTVLKLEYVRIKNLRLTKKQRRKNPHTSRLLPNLKTMYLKNVHFYEHALFYLIRECPSIQDLSLTSCHCENSEFDISSSSLNSLEIEHCDSRVISIGEAKNLESFKVSSNSSPLENIVLRDTSNLKHINVDAEHLKQLIIGSHDCLEATINTPNLVTFIFEGNLNSKVVVKAPNLKVVRIFLWELLDGDVPAFNGPFRHFPTLRDFLENIGFSKRVVLYVRDFKALLFPEDFKKNFSAPLYGVKHLVVVIPNSSVEVRDISDFRNALSWMAPSTNQLSIGEENYEQYLAHSSFVGL